MIQKPGNNLPEKKVNERAGSAGLYAPLYVFVVALTLRGLYVATTDAIRPTGPGAESYDSLAANYLEGRGLRTAMGPSFGDEYSSFLPPVFPLFLAEVYKVFGLRDYLMTKIVLCFVSSLTCLLICSLAKDLFEPRIGAIAGWLAAGYPEFIYYCGHLSPETLYIFLLVLWVRVLYAAAGPTSATAWVGCGMLFGLAALTRISLTGFLPLAAVFLLFWRGGGMVKRFLPLVLGAALPFAVWSTRNFYVHGKFAVLTTGGGYAFWAANRAGATGGGEGPLPAPEEAAMFRNLSELERDRLFWHLGLADVYKRGVGRQALLMANKFFRLWRLWPHADQVGAGKAFIAGAAFVPLLAAALAGVIISRERWRDFLIFYFLAFYLSVVHMVFAALTRHRLALAPFMIVFAAFGAKRILLKLRRNGECRG